ncbi:MAG: hypothetical protein LQ337_008124 [Flavoplaca oasis]|nr:MAG: hypothetical protein LQ337_008124 [Flavoplaca oasis]
MGDRFEHWIADGFIVLPARGKTAPNGKPAGKEVDEDIAPTLTQESEIPLAAKEHDVKEQVETEPQLTLPPGWEEERDKWGRRYFIDHNTRSTTWEAPDLSDAQSTVTSQTDEACNQPPLPEGWAQDIDPSSKRVYYMDHKTKTTTWVRPIPGNEETTKPLPKGWERRRTRDGWNKIYYVDHNTKTCTWDYPKAASEDVKVPQVPGAERITSEGPQQDS